MMYSGKDFKTAVLMLIMAVVVAVVLEIFLAEPESMTKKIPLQKSEQTLKSPSLK